MDTWILIVIALVVVFAAVLYFGRPLKFPADQRRKDDHKKIYSKKNDQEKQ